MTSHALVRGDTREPLSVVLARPSEITKVAINNKARDDTDKKSHNDANQAAAPTYSTIVERWIESPAMDKGLLVQFPLRRRGAHYVEELADKRTSSKAHRLCQQLIEIF